MVALNYTGSSAKGWSTSGGKDPVLPRGNNIRPFQSSSPTSPLHQKRTPSLLEKYNTPTFLYKREIIFLLQRAMATMSPGRIVYRLGICMPWLWQQMVGSLILLPDLRTAENINTLLCLAIFYSKLFYKKKPEWY